MSKRPATENSDTVFIFILLDVHKLTLQVRYLVFPSKNVCHDSGTLMNESGAWPVRLLLRENHFKEECMATTRNRRVTRRTSAMGIQRQINTDYAALVRDYGKLGAKLLSKPLTRYVLGGVALTVLSPFVLRMFRNPEVQTFITDNVEGIRSRIDGMIHSGEETFESLNQ